MFTLHETNTARWIDTAALITFTLYDVLRKNNFES